MKIVTFNIRYDCGLDDINNFDYRKALILEVIRREKPDIICFQEVLPHVARWLKEQLTEYCILGCPREPGFKGEQVCIAYLPLKFQVLKMDTYWLSPTPLVPGSRYDVQSICPRTCTELTLLEEESGKVFRLVNTHLDHEGTPARVLGAQQILNKLRSEPFFPGIPAIVVGDMNAEPGSEEMELLGHCPELRSLTDDIGITFHGFGKTEPVQIDWIFAAPSIECHSVKKWTDSQDGVFLSDHYPVCAELTLS